MNKSILVIDTPKDCLYCPCFRGRNNEFNFDDCMLALRPLTVEERDYKPSWCPLKPLPKKYIKIAQIENGIVKNNEEIQFMRGWNDCLDEILGVTNE